jgi:energy-coupling factor transporter ATP-binding protein EcfA2
LKVVLASSLWNQPHILILDEPTNYLDRESLGALSNAIDVFEGGCVMITHNIEFCSALCPETWILKKGEDDTVRIENKGDALDRKEKTALEKPLKAAKKAGDYDLGPPLLVSTVLVYELASIKTTAFTPTRFENPNH